MIHRIAALPLLVVLGGFAAGPAVAQAFSDAGFTSEVVTSLPALKPVGLTWAPDGRMFIWQKDGVVRIFKNGALLPTPFLDISSQVNTYVDRGALGFALHPDFANNGYAYVLFTREEGGNPNDASPKVSRLIRVTANPSNPDVALPGSELILLGSIGTPPCSSSPTGSDCIPSDSNTHSIGTLRFAPDGKLFVGNGDGADAGGVDARALRARDLNQYSGKILRINDDGTAPGDNPFDDGTNSIRSKVWAYGLRNPYRFTLDPSTNDVLLGDVGWNTWEEADRVVRGQDYGWPCYEGFLAQPLYSAQLGDCGLLPPGSVTPPLVAWAHDDVSPALPGYDPTFLGSAAIGGPVYTGASYPELYRGSYFYADYTGGWVRRLTFEPDGHVHSNSLFATGLGGIVSLEQGPNDDLYYVQFSTGQIRRIRFNGPVARATASPSYGYSPLGVTFTGDQSLNPGGGSLSYLWQFGDGQTSTVANPVHTYVSATVATFNARLTVTDPSGKFSSADLPITVGSVPPTPRIDVPSDGTGYRPGQLVAFQGSATDPEETLGSSALGWTVLLHHNDHIHTMLESSGATGGFTAQYHGPAGSYSYELGLTATDSSGLTGSTSVTLPILADTTAPAAPSGLAAAARGTSRADLTWTASTDDAAIDRYHVERCAGASCVTFAEIAAPVGAGTSYTDGSLAPATTYRYRVRAADGSGNLGSYSNVAVATTAVASGLLAAYAFDEGSYRVRGVDGAGNPSAYSTSASTSSPAATGLVLAFGLGEGTGTTTTDSSGNANTGTITGASWNTTGRYGSSLTFNGTGHVVLIPSSASLNLSTAMTLEAWVFPTANQTGWRAILQRETDAYMLHASSQGALRPTGGGTFNGSLDYFNAGSSIPINTWTHLALTWNGATMRLYVNGAEVASKARTGTLQGSSSGAGAVRIGNNVPYGERFIGRIDEVRVYNRALSASEITTDMATPIGGDTTPPTVPGSVSATADGASQITLGWSASTDSGGSGLAGYRVERCTGPGCSSFAQIAQPSTTALVDTGLAPSTTYRYRVRAVDGAGNPSGYSTIAEATTSAAPDTTPPTVPGSLSATANGASQITLGWTASTDSGGSGLAGYRVERCTGPGCSSFAQIAQPSTTALVDTGLAPSTTYRYRVRAVDGAGNPSGYSTIAEATTSAAPDTTPPTVPGSLSATANGASQITLGWTASTDSGGSGLAGYRVERCTGAGCSSFAEIAQPSTNAFVNTGLAPSTTYRYRVRAVDGAGNPSGYSSTANATTGSASDTLPPTAPTSLLATPNGTSEIDLTWTASSDSGGSGLAGYRIERCAGAGCTNFTEIGTSVTNAFADTALPPAAPSATELGRVAAAMAPGTWAEVSTLNIVPTLIADGLGGSILDYAEDGAWDPVTQQFLFIGSDHPFDFQTGDLARFVAYSALTNTWRTLPDPSWFPDFLMHGYDHNAIDAARGRFYHRAYATPSVYRYDIDTGAWSALPQIPNAVLANNTCCAGLEYFPEMNGLVLAGTTHETTTDEAILYSDATGTWSTVADGRPMGTYNHFVEYNPVRHTVLFGGGQGSRKIYTMSASGAVTAGRDAPFGLGILESVVTVDPVSGLYLVLGSGGEFYSYDEVADRWTSLPATVPLFDLPVRGTSLVWQILATPVSNYGVTMFVKFYWADTASQAWVYLYKHAASAPEATYRYRVRAIDGASNLSGYSNVADTTTNPPPDTTAPTVPAGLSASASGTSQITLGWTASTDSGGSGLAGYRVERCAGSGCSSFAEIAQPTTNALVDTGLAASTTYRYRVRAVDGAGNPSGVSGIAEATTTAPPDTTPPTVPGALGATANGASQITLGWTASTDSGGSGLAGYRVERCTGTGCSGFAEIAQPTTNAFVNTGLAPSTTYRYRVRAIDGAGNASGYASVAEATTTAPPDTTPPTVPGALTATANGTTQITLGWTASTDSGGSGLAGYRVERCEGASCSSFAEIAQPATNAFVDTGLLASTTYRYRVRAIDGAGNPSGYSSIATQTTSAPADTTTPTVPAALTATANGTSQITLGWTTATDAGGSGLAGYRVERCQGASCSSFAEIAQPVTNALVDTGLLAGTTYRYRVRAIDGAGNPSGYSAIASAQTSTGGGLVASYGFNEGAGLVASDTSGNGNTGTITGATWNTTGKFGSSLTFNGTGHVVSIPSSTSLNLSTAMTLEAWVYPTSAQTGWRAIIQRERDAYLLHAGYSGGALRPTAGGTFGTALDYFASTTALTVNAWSHLALTWDGTIMRLYVNGAQVATRSRTGTLQGTSAGAGTVRIGNNVPYGERFIGQIDEVRIYNRALSAAEVTTDMNAPVP